MNKMLVAVGCALVSAFAVFADGENPYPEYDFYLTANDSNDSSKLSWNKTGHWSGEWPDDAVKKTFYVPAGKTLCSFGTSSAKAGLWLGGTLTVAGKYESSPRGSSGYCASITNLVFLDDSIFCGGAYGLLLDDARSDITVKASADHPLKVQYDYGSGSNSYYGRFPAVVHGAPGTGMIFMMIQAASTFRFHANSFEDFFGTLTVTGAKVNPMRPSSNSHWFTSPGKLVVTDSAVFTPSDPAADKARNNVLLGALDVNNGGIIDFRCNSTDAFVTFGVTNSFKVSDGGIVRVSNVTAAKLVSCANSGAAADYRMAVRLAKLTGDAKDQVDVDDAKVTMIDEIYGDAFGWKLIVQDNADGSKELYAGVTNVAVCIKNGTNGAKPSDSTLWAGGVPPQEGVDIYSPYRFNPFPNFDFTKSRLFFGNSGNGHYWYADSKATLDLNAKSYCVLESTGITLWGGTNARRRWRGGPLRIVDGATLSIGFADTCPQFRFESEVVGNGGLTWRQRTDGANYKATLENLNTNWHGRLTIQASPDKGSYTYNTILGDARNWGGEFLADADTYSAVTIASNTCVYVTNNVCFNEPTRGFLLRQKPQFRVQAGFTLTLSNQVTYAGVVTKSDAGVLELGGTARFVDGQPETAPAATSNELVIAAGALKVSSATAVDGLDVSFAAGTKLVVGKDCGFYNVKSANPLTIADEKLSVEIAGFDEKPEGCDVEVAVLTLNKAAAEGIGTDKFAFTKTKACRVLKFEKREVGDNVEYVATVAGTKGIVFIVR